MIILENVTKTFGTGEAALSDISLSIDKGEFIFLVGPSGSGKTTFFRLLTREYLPTKGTIHVNDWNIVKLPKKKIPHLRRKIGVVFQDIKLLIDRTILENIMLPLQIAGMDGKKASLKALEIMSQVGIEGHKHKFPVQLSGGELQRAAIARAIVFSPEILIADEPTGNLDATTSWEIVSLLHEINKSGTTILMTTHNQDIVRKMGKRVIVLEKGVITDSGKPASTVEEDKQQDKEEKTEEQHSKHHTAHEKKNKKEEKE